ncbi:MAG: glycoside hydrolase family 140 protein [Gemmataceae bacterium]
MRWWIGLLLATMVVAPVLAEVPRPKVSANKRFLVTQDDQPFFYLADTAWELFHRLNREQTETYLKDRAARGYTVIQAVLLAELDGLGTPNAFGEVPLKDNDPTKPNEKYFAHVDWVITRANQLGLIIGVLPTWGDKWHKKWGVGPEIFTPENAASYGEWLGRRYKDRGVIWIVGGDRPIESDRHRAIVTAMAKGLRKGDGGQHLITFHPQGGQGSAQYFHDADWLDFNMRQNGHQAEYTGRYDKTRADYDRTPIKPVLDGEPIYEDHPLSFKPKELGYSVAADVRRPLYWNLFSGACGHTYGNHCVWQMVDKGRKPVNHPPLYWHQALKQPGADQMQYGRWLLESRPYLSRIPDDGVIVPDPVELSVPGAGTRRFVATRCSEGSYAMVYAPVSKPFTVRLDKLQGKQVTAWWYNPRTGEATKIDTFERTGTRRFTPPTLGEQLDWVLVLDNAEKRFPPPGTRKAR